MTSFVNTNYSSRHQGADRVEAVMDAARQARGGFSGTRGFSTLLLSAVAAAVMVVAYQVMDSITEGHLLVMWIAMWFVAFAVLAMFANAARRIAVRTKRSLDDWSSSLAEARADQRLWATARQDSRVMAELQAAMTRSESCDETSAAPAAGRAVKSRAYSVQRAYERNYL